MTEVKYSRKPYSIEMSGHAEYGKEDIVCAGLSMLCGALDATCEGKHGYASTGTKNAGFFRCEYKGKDKRVLGMFDMTVTGFKILAHKYPDNVTVTRA